MDGESPYDAACGRLSYELRLPEPDPPSLLTKDILNHDLIPDDDNTIISLARNWPYIRTHYHINNRFEDIYVIRLQYGSIDEVTYYTEVVLKGLRNQARVNIAFSYVLEKKYSHPTEYRVFYASRNTGFHETMQFVTSWDEILTFLSDLQAVDLFEELGDRIPDSKWKLHSIISITIHVGKFPEPML